MTASLEKQAAFASHAEIRDRLSLDADLLNQAHRRFPVAWPKYYLGLAQEPAIARMGRPEAAELAADQGDLADAVADRAQRPIPFVVRKHTDRVIILAAKRCHFYCRFCFRRDESVRKAAEPGLADWERIYAFLADHPEIQEPILSGGDPLTLSDRELIDIGSRLATIGSVRRWRIHTRAPVHYPQRIQEDLWAQLSRVLPLTVVTHFNNVAEITAESVRIAKMMARYGIDFQNQAVLLRGVNDDVPAQKALWEKLYALGMGARYLHHPDRTPGNADFRVTLERGLAIYRGFCGLWNGPVPTYVLDLPDGRGKVPVEKLFRVGPGKYSFQHPNGEVSHYQDFA